MMKKLCTVLLALILVLFAGTALAKTAEQGDTSVTVAFTVTSENGVSAVFHIAYSEAALEFVSASGGASAPTDGKGSFTYISPMDHAAGSVTFNVKKNAAPGNYAFSVELISCKDVEGKDTECAVNVETLTVKTCSHPATSTVVRTKPTCTDTGISAIVCSKCEAEIQTTVTAALRPIEGHTVVTDAAVAPTCTDKGKTEGKHCSYCNAVIAEQQEVAALGHNFVSGACTRCGTVDPDYGYEFYTDGSRATITAYKLGSGSVYVPTKLGGATVTGIASGAFGSGVRNIYIGKNITTIADGGIAAGTVVHCYTGSYAQNWASKNGYTVKLLDAGKEIEIDVPSSIDMDEGSTMSSPFTIICDKEYPTPVYKSYSESIVKVSSNGTLTAVKEGTAVIELKVGTETKTTTVKVRKAVTGFELSQTEIYLVSGKKQTLTLKNIEPAGATPVITWTTSDKIYATVSASGEITAGAAGTVVITARDMSGVMAQCIVHVAENVTEVKFAETNYTVETGKTVQTIANVKAGDASYTNKLVEFKSSNTAVATVDTVTGEVKGVSAGTATITATALSGKTASCTVTVKLHEHTLVIDAAVPPTCEEDGLKEGKHCLYCDYVVAQVKDPAIGHEALPAVNEKVVTATCSVKGSHDEVVYCKHCGKEMSRVTKDDGLGTHDWVTTPKVDPTCISVGYEEGKYCKNCSTVEKETKEIAKLPHNWVSVVRVDPTYDTEGCTEGVKCSMCGTVKSGCKPIAKKVRPDPKQVILSVSADIFLKPSATKTLSATLDPADAKPGITWLSSEPTVASVDANGKITALKEGSAVITAQSVVAKVKATVKVYVTAEKRTAYITFNQSSPLVMHVGDEALKLTYTQTPSDSTETVTFASSDTAILTVDAEGKIKPVKSGTAQVTVRTETGKTASLTVNVHAVSTIKGKAATCEQAGLSDGRRCSKCGVVEPQVTVAALGHSATTIPALEATCYAVGYSTGVKCTRCGKTLVQPLEIAKTAHTPETDPAVAPSCLKPGYTAGSHCKNCGEILTKQNVIPATGHTPGAEVIENKVDATCLVTGSYDVVKYCTVCTLEISRETKTIGLKDHTVVIIPGKEATATETGLTDGRKCIVCDTILVPQVVIPVTGGRIPGDVNNDGTVNGVDGIILLQHLAGRASVNTANADVNGDGTVNGLDGIRLLQYLAGWSVTLK